MSQLAKVCRSSQVSWSLNPSKPVHSFTENLLISSLHALSNPDLFKSSPLLLRRTGEQFGRVCPRIFCNGRFLTGSDKTPLSNLELGDSPLQCLPSNLALKSKRSSAPKSAPKKRDEEKVSCLKFAASFEGHGIVGVSS